MDSRWDDDAPTQPAYTLHVEFTANNLNEARHAASEYVEALQLLRPTEIHAHTAWVSGPADHSGQPVYCRASSPASGSYCTLVVHDPDERHEDATHLRWTSGMDLFAAAIDTFHTRLGYPTRNH